MEVYARSLFLLLERLKEMFCDICRKYGYHLPQCPYASEPRIRGNCTMCNKELLEGYEYYKDEESNKFCSDKCAMEYHGIKLIDKE